jgi:hypothetical protein
VFIYVIERGRERERETGDFYLIKNDRKHLCRIALKNLGTSEIPF